jgi:hypothetical protein
LVTEEGYLSPALIIPLWQPDSYEKKSSLWGMESLSAAIVLFCSESLDFHFGIPDVTDIDSVAQFLAFRFYCLYALLVGRMRAHKRIDEAGKLTAPFVFELVHE